MRDFAFVLSLASGFAKPAPGGRELPAPVDTGAPQSPCCGERVPRLPEALRLAPTARLRLPTAKPGH